MSLQSGTQHSLVPSEIQPACACRFERDVEHACGAVFRAFLQSTRSDLPQVLLLVLMPMNCRMPNAVVGLAWQFGQFVGLAWQFGQSCQV